MRAFNKLFIDIYPSMCSVAESFIKDDDKSRDIVQEAFINFWSKKEQYESMKSVKTFLYVSVKNLCLNYLRDTKEKSASDAELLEKIEGSFDNMVIEEESVRMINSAIDNLPTQSSKIMKLTIEGVKNMEIAEILGISVNSVKTLKYNALKTLKVTLKDYYFLFLFFLRNN